MEPGLELQTLQNFPSLSGIYYLIESVPKINFPVTKGLDCQLLFAQAWIKDLSISLKPLLITIRFI